MGQSHSKTKKIPGGSHAPISTKTATTSSVSKIKRGMVDTFLGSIAYHILREDHSENYLDKETIDNKSSIQITFVCLHSSPRSSDEFLDIMPIIFENEKCTVIALDCPGYGNSENPNKSCTLEEIGSAYLHVLQKLNLIDQFLHGDHTDSTQVQWGNKNHKKIILVGSLMGNFISLSIASRYPQIVSACVLVNLYYFPKKDSYAIPSIYSTAEDNKTALQSIPDPWELHEDGSMLANLFTKRPWAGNELNLRIVHSEITYLMNRRRRYQNGISIEDLPDVDLEPTARKTSCPVLCVKGKSSLEFLDKIGLRGTHQFDSAVAFLSRCEVKELEGVESNINLVNQMAMDLARLIHAFVKKYTSVQ